MGYVFPCLLLHLAPHVRVRGGDWSGEVSVSYYSLINNPTFPLWGEALISAHHPPLGSSYTNAEIRHSCPINNVTQAEVPIHTYARFDLIVTCCCLVKSCQLLNLGQSVSYNVLQ